MKRFALILAAALVAGCHSAPTRMYTLRPIAAPGPAAAYAGPPLRVDGVHVPAELDRAEVTTRVAADELKISETDHWSAPLARLAQQALTENLITRLPQGKVVLPHLSNSAGGWSVWVDLLEFTSDARGDRLEASWQFDVDGKPVADSHAGVAELETSGAAQSADQVAERLSALLALLADRIAADLALQAGAAAASQSPPASPPPHAETPPAQPPPAR